MMKQYYIFCSSLHFFKFKVVVVNFITFLICSGPFSDCCNSSLGTYSRISFLSQVFLGMRW